MMYEMPLCNQSPKHFLGNAPNFSYFLVYLLCDWDNLCVVVLLRELGIVNIFHQVVVAASFMRAEGLIQGLKTDLNIGIICETWH